MIPFVDLRAQLDSIRPEVNAAIGRVLESCQFVLGDEVTAFEEEFAKYCGVRYAVAVNSGTSALHLALLALNVGPGDEVITVPFTFVATVAAIRYAGAKPVLVDIDPHSFTMDAEQVERAITKRTKAILPVHLYGQPADMDPILDIARRHGLAVIEDAAQAHGAQYKGRDVGGIGEMGCFSFYPGKNLGGYGEGGAVTTNNPEHADMLRILRDWGQKQKYNHCVKAYNYRMDGIQGAVLRVKLPYLNGWTEKRRANAVRYNALLSAKGIQVPQQMPYAKHVYHVYVIRVPKRDLVQSALSALDIQTGIHYPIPVHRQEAHRDLLYRAGDFPCSEKAAAEVLSLPMFAELSVEQQEQVARAINH